MCTGCDKHGENSAHIIFEHLLFLIMLVQGIQSLCALQEYLECKGDTHAHTEQSKHEQGTTEICREKAEEGHITQVRGWGPPHGAGNT